jgi:hypothetical protein
MTGTAFEGAREGRGPDLGATNTVRPRMILRSWRRLEKSGSSLIGFASVTLPIGLEIDDIPVLMTAGKKPWASMPAKPIITKDGLVAKLPGSSKIQYVNILRWRDRKLSQGFSARVVELVRAVDPEAVANEGAQ